MSNKHITGGFRTEDITFKGVRKQHEILKESPEAKVVDTSDVEVPVSLTPEQLIQYYLECIAGTPEQEKRRVFAKTIHLIEENKALKEELHRKIAKEMMEDVKERD